MCGASPLALSTVRAIPGLVALLALFAAAAWWQGDLIDGLRRERDAATGAGTAGRLPGWGELIVGRPSGAASVAPATPPDPTPLPEPAPADFPRAPLSASELQVQPGENLWKLVQRHYGRVDPDLVQDVADYNELPDANTLQAGQRLWLPSLEELLGKGGSALPTRD